MKSSFKVDSGKEYLVEVDLRWWGGEYYYVDGELVLKIMSPSFRGERMIEVGGRNVTISLVATTKEYGCSVLVDGEVLVCELFPEFKAKVYKAKESRERKGTTSYLIKNVTIWIVIAIILLSVFENSKEKECESKMELKVEKVSQVLACK